MFKSNDELFQATKNIISALDNKGYREASIILENGLRAMNGLTDGWALFLESIDLIRIKYQSNSDLDKNEKRLLIRIR